MMKIEYNSNNSGGGWWLKDEDWINLEAAGWEVEWGGRFFCGGMPLLGIKKPTYDFSCRGGNLCKGHRAFDSYKKMTNEDRWLGGLARSASKDFDNPRDAILEFEKVVGQSVMDEGCNCCGAPHSFSWESGGCSGEDCGRYIYGEDGALSKRELLEKRKNS